VIAAAEADVRRLTDAEAGLRDRVRGLERDVEAQRRGAPTGSWCCGTAASRLFGAPEELLATSAELRRLRAGTRPGGEVAR
jgi:hypothetical protein